MPSQESGCFPMKRAYALKDVRPGFAKVGKTVGSQLSLVLRLEEIEYRHKADSGAVAWAG
jgi:hypothetical protein